MLAKGNGDPLVCASNLIKTVRGEVPYERVKGLPRDLIDRPSSHARPKFNAEVQWLIETYEPRLDIDHVDISAIEAASGNFDFRTFVKEAD